MLGVGSSVFSWQFSVGGDWGRLARNGEENRRDAKSAEVAEGWGRVQNAKCKMANGGENRRGAESAEVAEGDGQMVRWLNGQIVKWLNGERGTGRGAVKWLIG